MIPVPQRRVAQPQYPVGIDRSNPLGKTITHCLPLNGDNREIVTGTQLTIGAGGSLGTDLKGRSLRGNGAAACASIPLDLSTYNKLTISFWLYWDAYAADDDLALEFTPNTNANRGFFIDPNYSGTAHYHTAIGEVDTTNAVTFDRPLDAKWNHLVFIFDRTLGSSSAAHKFFVDGVERPVVAQQGIQALTGNFANSTLFLFSRNNASLFAAGRMQNLVIRGGYRMSAAEAKAEYDNPWQIFPPISRKIWVASGATAAVSNDLADSYLLRSNAIGDLADSYALRANILSDLADSYALRVNAAADLADSYLLRSNAIGDLADTYLLRANIGGDLEDMYVLRANILSDLADSYGIASGNFSSELNGIELNALEINSSTLTVAVFNDIADSYFLRVNAANDLADLYLLRANAANDLADLYLLRANVAGNLSDGYSLRANINRDLMDEYRVSLVRTDSFVNLVRTGSSTTLTRADKYSTLTRTP